MSSNEPTSVGESSNNLIKFGNLVRVFDKIAVTDNNDNNNADDSLEAYELKLEESLRTVHSDR